MTANTTSSEQSLQDYLDQGLRGMWYPVLASWEVGNNPVGITRLEQQIVVWRDGEGQIHALEDRCPHRGARLSMGWNLGDRIACWYHGVEVGGDGTVKDVPAVDRCPLVGQKCLRSYPAKEAYGAVFLYFGVTADEAPAELTFPQELADEASYSNFLCTASWNCNYQYALENVMDPMHGTYLHSSSHSMAEGDRKADMGLEPTDSGFIFKKNGQIGVNFDWVEFGNSGAYWMRLSIPYKKRFGPGGHFWIIGMVVPEDKDHCRVFFWRIRKVKDWQRDMWRFMYRNRLESLHWDVLEQDRIVLENMAPNARGREYLYQHDVGLSRLRRLMQKEAQKQLATSGAALREQGAQVETQTIDLASPDSIRSAFEKIAAGGGIDGLVNNAALATGVGGKTMMEYDIDLWDRVMQVNVRGTWLVSQAAVPLLARSPHAKIVNVASDTALWGAPRLMAYVASKGALIAMTRSMARELGPQGICVNAIAPGLTRVEATEYVPAERHQLYEQGRALAGAQHPDDVNGTVLYLLSPLADFVTGQLLPVNGGFVFN